VPANPRKSGEFERIARYFAPLTAAEPGAVGLRDDAAFLNVPEGHELIVTTDAVVAGVHFLPTDPPELIARKALRVNLSDLAAKGAVPRWYLLDAAFPKNTGDAWIADFARGLAKDQVEFGIHLVGGDTVAMPGPATFAITALGVARAGQGLKRGGAQRGDDIYVSGTIGDGALGLLAWQGKLGSLGPKQRDELADRYRLPRPRVALGPRLINLATAAIDVSDGLAADLGHIAETSNLGATIETALVPLSAAAREAVSKRPALMDRVLAGGDDYEILFTAPWRAAKHIRMLERELRVKLTRIGRMEAGKGVKIVDPKGKQLRLKSGGWTHA
jgi:thiamine-monophosphate kinase